MRKFSPTKEDGREERVKVSKNISDYEGYAKGTKGCGSLDDCRQSSNFLMNARCDSEVLYHVRLS